MSAVNLWKAWKLQSHILFTRSCCKWVFVRIAENYSCAARFILKRGILSSTINIFSASFANLLHRTLVKITYGWEWITNTQLAALQTENRKRRPKSGRRSLKSVREMPSELLQSVHQTRNRAVQVFVRPAQLFNLVDGVQYCGVMLSAELPANLG